MGQYPREEIEAAFARYNEARDQASKTGDWKIWAAMFTEDAHYIEHAYGEMHGRVEIEKWITGVMAPFPYMTFPQQWVAFDADTDAVVFQCMNRLEHPTDPKSEAFEFPSWTRLVYGGNGLFKSEEDVYNPARDAGRVISGWRKAGGIFESKELVHMKDR